ncbi:MULTISPECIES: G5 domain-containing protein [Bifidobacterium]|uniref:aggregation-promoting factor C-terminal-like domain-containing protein n=1 Tax=Bifidobacterium TaxID=1678 RepID=UPI001BDD80FE|nr:MULTISPECIES: G5 domain-containing protein [Bifidobacterium]MBT1160995.1 G5 domain-containing protein [Bifidobacterium sp. SO1]MBW3079525.1 G5 domain-containing protein [Bifidobacterium simiiventris]
MANHSKHTPTLKSLSKRQWAKLGAIVAAVGMLAGAGVVSRNFYVAEHHSTASQQVTSYSATDPNALEVSRGQSRTALRGADADTTYVTVKVNGQSRTVLGTDFTDVKSVLDAGDITLEPNDKVSPALTDPVSESTVITIERAGTQVETKDEPIAFNEVRKETADLPKGTEKVETEGQEGVMETTSLVTRSGDQIISSNVFTSYVKKAPVDKVILVGTAEKTETSNSTATSSDIGTTTPVGDMQQWAHDYLLANGYSEADFTATAYIINHESGWRVNATNGSSGAYGLAQALPGSKMASAGADWATNYQTQLKWFWGYCTSRYGSIQGAYAFWTANHWY